MERENPVESQAEATRALDALIAERVMGWRWVTAPWVWDDPQSPVFGPDANYLLPPGGVEATRDAMGNWPTSGAFTYPDTERVDAGRRLTWHRMPSYASRMEDAWLVVDLLRTRGWYCTLADLTPREYPPARKGETWRCAFGHYPQLMDVAAEAPAPARAICLAALRAYAARGW